MIDFRRVHELGVKFHFDLPPTRAKQLEEYIGNRFKSEVIRNIVTDFLDGLKPQDIVKAPPAETARANNAFLNERYKCKETQKWSLVKELLCVSEDIECRHEKCQLYIKKRLEK